MAAKFFGEFLIEKKLISEQDLEKVLDVQKHSNQKLGELAVSSAMLTENIACEINQKQQTENKLFGEIAVACGYLDIQQLDDLLLMQQKQRKFFGDILIELKMLTNEQVIQQLKAHDKAQQQTYQNMLTAIDKHCLAEYLIQAIEASNLLFLRILHEQSKFYQLIKSTENLDSFEVVLQISLNAQHPIFLTFATDAQTAICIASAFTNEDVANCDLDFSQDAVGEFLNIIAAQIISALNQSGKFDYGVPEYNVNLAELCMDASSMLVVEMDSPIGNYILIVHEEN